MQTEAIFENISERLLSEINKAEKSIYIAVAWFTNYMLFEALVNKATKGCNISLIISDDNINQNSSIDFEQLHIGKSKVYKVGNSDTELMHNKFCVIDFNTVITGSYNWSYKAENNFENIIITSNDTNLAEQFINEFNNIRKQYFPNVVDDETKFPLNIIIKRLEIIKNYILLEDINELNSETIKLKEYEYNTDIFEILKKIENKKYSKALENIQDFVTKNQKVNIWTDPEIAKLKLEIKVLENQINGYDNEKIELEKIIAEFQHRHTKELGNLILNILKLRKIKYKSDKTKFEEAEKDEKEYKEQVNVEKEKEIINLNEEQKAELKKKFRTATIICHPDKVSDEFKLDAQEIFVELKNAYDTNDLNKVSEILDELEKGHYFKAKSETVVEKDLLKSAIAKLKIQIKILEKEIITIKESDAYRIINDINDWDDYFTQTKEKLNMELEELQLELI